MVNLRIHSCVLQAYVYAKYANVLESLRDQIVIIPGARLPPFPSQFQWSLHDQMVIILGTSLTPHIQLSLLDQMVNRLQRGPDSFLQQTRRILPNFGGPKDAPDTGTENG